jgi:hypothetical protein
MLGVVATCAFAKFPHWGLSEHCSRKSDEDDLIEGVVDALTSLPRVALSEVDRPQVQVKDFAQLRGCRS